MAKLFLLRHFKSEWNLENRFTGWVDVPLIKGQEEKIKKMAQKIFNKKIDVIYSSPLFRNQDSVSQILDYSSKYPIFIHLDKGRMKKRGRFKETNKKYIPVYVSEKLNERYYGILQGQNKNTMIRRYGKEKIHLWRRSFRKKPPQGETLRQTYKRAVPFFKKYIEKDLKKGKNVLIVSSHNPLRALVKYLDRIPEKDIINLEIDYGQLIEYSKLYE